MKKYRKLSLRYPGGKSRVAKKIISKMEPHEKYVEPFAGAAHVFLKKPKAKSNVLNDTNKDITRFLKAIKGKKLCCNIKDDKATFNRILKKKNKTPCDFIALNQRSYSGDMKYFSHPGTKSEQCFDGTKLKGVRITNQDFRKTIKNHDSKNTLFYVDPPYVKANEKRCLYGKDGCKVTPKEVADAVKKIKGKAIISYDNHPSVRKAFKGCKIGKIEFPYTYDGKKGQKWRKTKELLITDCK